MSNLLWFSFGRFLISEICFQFLLVSVFISLFFFLSVTSMNRKLLPNKNLSLLFPYLKLHLEWREDTSHFFFSLYTGEFLLLLFPLKAVKRRKKKAQHSLSSRVGMRFHVDFIYMAIFNGEKRKTVFSALKCAALCFFLCVFDLQNRSAGTNGL